MATAQFSQKDRPNSFVGGRLETMRSIEFIDSICMRPLRPIDAPRPHRSLRASAGRGEWPERAEWPLGLRGSCGGGGRKTNETNRRQPFLLFHLHQSGRRPVALRRLGFTRAARLAAPRLRECRSLCGHARLVAHQCWRFVSAPFSRRATFDQMNPPTEAARDEMDMNQSGRQTRMCLVHQVGMALCLAAQ